MGIYLVLMRCFGAPVGGGELGGLILCTCVVELGIRIRVAGLRMFVFGFADARDV